MKTNISREARVNILDNAVRQQALCDKLGEIVNVYPDDYALHLSVLLETLYGIDVENIPNEKYDVYCNLFNESLKHDEFNFREKAGLIDENFILELDLPEECEESEPNPVPVKLVDLDRKGIVLKILEDSIIWHRASKGMIAINSAFSPEFHNQYGFEPEEQYHGFTIAYPLIGVSTSRHDEPMANLLHSIFVNTMEFNDNLDTDRRGNAKYLAKTIYKEWSTVTEKRGVRAA